MTTVQLQVVQGKQRGKCLFFPLGEFVFGRGPECHVRPNSELISRQHCLLAVNKNAATIRDLGSANGTLVNGGRVRGEQVLFDGDRIQLGALVLLVKIPKEATNPVDTLSDSRLYQEGSETITDGNLVEPEEGPSGEIPNVEHVGR
jgi:pSer/pThr/pTyr-binding forkhead associated (FHA) protein